MYFTIPATSPSTPPLSSDAVGSLTRLRVQANLLATISASFTQEAKQVVGAYASALCEGSPETWTAFVGAAATLAAHAESVRDIVRLSEKERQAVDFFAQIVRENEDLLTTGSFVAA